MSAKHLALATLVSLLFTAACSGQLLDTANDFSEGAEPPVDASAPDTHGDEVADANDDVDAIDAPTEDGAPRDVVASTNDPTEVHVHWSPPAGATPDGYVVVRDGRVVATLSATTFSFDDDGVEPGVLAAPTGVTATIRTWADGVRVAWAPVVGAAGTTHSYVVRAVHGGSNGPDSVPANGGRSAPDVTGYEVEIRGAWVSAGTATLFEDRNAATAMRFDGASVTAITDISVGAIRLRAIVPATSTLAGTASYRIRARSADSVGPASSSVIGQRAPSTTVHVQWQRSAGDSDANYTDLPDVTGLSWYDDTGPLDGSGRYYRASLRAGGAVGTTPAQRATLMGFSQAAVVGGTTCGVRTTDGALVCWGAVSSTRTQGAPYARLFSGTDSICVLQADGVAFCVGGAQPPTVTFATLDPDSRCGKTPDGQVLCWGDRPAPPPEERFRTFAYAGGACGLRLSDATPVCWPGTWTNTPQVALEDIAIIGNYACGRRSADHVPVCWTDGGVVPAPPDAMKELAGYAGSVCGVRASDDRVVCWPDYPNSSPSNAGIVGPSTERFADLRVLDGSFCGTRLDDGRFACRGSLTTTLDGATPYLSGKVIGTLLPGGRLRIPLSSFLPPKTSFDRVALGPSQTCAVRSADGQVSCIPRGFDFEPPAGLGAVSALAFGSATTCALHAADGRRTCWGSTFGPAAPPGDSAEAYAAIADDGHSSILGIRAADAALAYFSPDSTIIPPAGSFRAVALGGGHTCAIRSADGKMVCWGTNTHGEAPPGPSADAYAEVAAGATFTCGVQEADHRLRCWGENQQPTVSPFAVGSVSARDSTICALRQSDHTEVCGPDLWSVAPSGYLADELRSIAVAPTPLGPRGPGAVCFITAEGRLGCH